MTPQEIAKEFETHKARFNLLKKQADDKAAEVIRIKALVENQIKARWVLTEVAQLTQQRFKSKVESLLTMAIQSVFERPFEFQLEFERKRNKMECRSIVTEIVNGKQRIFDEIEDDLGGGLVDIIAFTSRPVLWSLEKPRSRNVILLDEPMKNMGKLITLGGQILREISHKLKFQLIIVTHDDELIEVGDRSYEVTHDGDHSNVRLVKGAPVEIQKKGLRINRG